MASIPKVTVEVAFDGGPFSSSYTWTDVSDYVEGLQVKRGRNDELGRIEAGTLSLSLDNSDGRFSPGKEKAGGNILSGSSGQVVSDLNGRANNTVMLSNNIGQVDDDGGTRLMTRTVYTSGAPVSCYFAVKWLDAGGATLRFVIGTRFLADSSPAVYTHREAPPAGTATAVVYIYADTYPEGNAGLTAYGEKAEWFKTQPYFPNVVPRRRVRVRTANLTPKDVSTGGDISYSSSLFSVTHVAGQTKDYLSSYSKSGNGSVRVDFGNNGSADWASGIYCGYSSSGAPKGLARVTPGKVYSTGSAVRCGVLSRDVNLKTRIRWYDSNLALVSTSAGGPSTALKGDRYNQTLNPSHEVDLTNIFAYGSGVTRARVTTEFYQGSASMEHTWTSDAVQAGSTYLIDSVTGAGKTIKFRFALKIPATGLSNFQLAFRNSSSTVKLINQAMPSVTNAWTTVETSYTLAAGETVDRVGFSFLGALNTKMWTDVMMCQVTAGTLPAYADGSMSGYHWAGNANASATVSDSWSPSWNQVSVLNQTAPANAVWAGVEIGTSGGDSNAYALIDEIQLEEGSTLSPWNPGGSIFHGYIEKWPVSSDGLTASVDVSAVDGFSVLGNTDLRAAMQAETLTTNPLGYWTLGDPVDSTRLENLASDQQPAKLVASKYGPGTPLLGADSIVAKDSTTCYSLANVSATQGTVIDICDNGQRNYPLGTDFSVGFWCLPVRPSSGLYNTLFAGWSDNGSEFMSIRLDSTGKLEIRTTYTEGTQTTLNSSVALSTSAPSYVVVTVEQGLTRLYVNGLYYQSDPGPAPTNKDIRDLRWASFAGRQAGSIYGEYANGRIAHLAIWDYRIAFADINPIWKLGDNGGVDFSEDEKTRIDRIATMANYQGETAYDAGVSTLQGPDWSTGASALDELQGAAQDASGYIFMDGDGRLTYHNRARRQAAAVRFELGDTVGLPWEPGLQFDMDDDRIINEVTYKRTNGIEGVLKDQASITAYGRKSTSVELGITSDSAVQDAAYTLLNTYAQPMVRCDSVTLKASATPELFYPVLSVEIGDRITLTDLPTAAPDSELDFYVEAIDTDVSVNGGTLEWVTTLSLSPAEGSDVWILEDSTLGRLDRTAILAY
jgi:hypothetical protein